MKKANSWNTKELPVNNPIGMKKLQSKCDLCTIKPFKIYQHFL